MLASKLCHDFDFYRRELEAMSADFGLDYYPVDFELVPPEFMVEIAVYGLPVRMPHWSFGVRYIYQFVQHRMGNSKIFEVVFPGDPGRAYLTDSNSLQENTLVVAHVLGHADFAKNNFLFKRAQEQVGYHIVEQAAAHAHRIEEAIEQYGQARVEHVLDAALALEQYIDDEQGLSRPLLNQSTPEQTDSSGQETATGDSAFLRRFQSLHDDQRQMADDNSAIESAYKPFRPERDLLWFIAHYSPDLEGWERDIFLAVREESFYFHPVFSCNIMNEGWASYWHARMLREASFLPDDLYIDAMKSHSDVVRPYAADNQVSLSINPYHLGFTMWNRIVERDGMAAARQMMEQEDDCSFIRNHLDADLADELGLFVYQSRRNGEIKVKERDIGDLHESILSPKYNFGAPAIAVSDMAADGSLELRHDYATDARGLDLERAKKVLEYVHSVWRRPVKLHTVDGQGEPAVIEVH